MKASADRIKEIEAELHDLEARRQGLLAEMREIRSAAESPEFLRPTKRPERTPQHP